MTRSFSQDDSYHPNEAREASVNGYPHDDDDPMVDTGVNDEGNDAEDGDEEVVREIDVFLSPVLSQNTYLMQYPGQPLPESSAANPMAHRLCVPASARIKPRHGLISAEHVVVSGSSSMTTPSLMRTFESQTIPVTTHLCLGKLVLAREEAAASSTDETTVRRDALHLVPLTHITQMRPIFAQNLEGDHAAGMDDMDQGTEGSNSRQQQQQPIGFTRKESDRAAAARKSSYAFKKASQDAEAWVDLAVVATTGIATSAASIFSDAHRGRLDDNDPHVIGAVASMVPPSNIHAQVLCPAPHQVIWSRPADEAASDRRDQASRYIQTLNYIPPAPLSSDNVYAHNFAIGGGPGPAGGSSSLLKAVIAKMTSVLQQTGGPVPFSILQSQFDGSQVTPETLLSALNVCAVLVRGNWCLHSKFLVISQSSIGQRKSAVERTSLPSLQHMRTFLLLLLQDEGVIDRLRLLHSFDETDPENTSSIDAPQCVVSLLQLVAKKQAVVAGSTTPNCQRSGWILKIDDDVGFLQQYPHVRALHESYWDRQRRRFARELALYHNAPLKM